MHTILQKASGSALHSWHHMLQTVSPILACSQQVHASPNSLPVFDHLETHFVLVGSSAYCQDCLLAAEQRRGCF